MSRASSEEEDYFTHADRLGELAELALEELGGRSFLEAAHRAAGRYVAENFRHA